MSVLRSAAASLLLLPLNAAASHLAPLRTVGVASHPLGVYSERTVVAAIEVDRDQARLLAYTVKPRPLTRALVLEPERSIDAGGPIQIEVVLSGPDGARFVQHASPGELCFAHPGDTPAHVEGDHIWLHRDSLLVELPEVAGFDRIEVALYEEGGSGLERRSLAVETLDRARFDAAGGDAGYPDLAFATPHTAPAPPAETPGQVHWPEEFGDPDRYLVYGDEAEGPIRVNIVIVPDGYTYAQKTLMRQHADGMVAYFRGKTPYAEHDPLINYTLVYAYSTQSGTDACDCNTVIDTAMNTRFPDSGSPCGDLGNRCLYYGTDNGGPNCDPQVSAANIAAAELRAPVRDTTVIMVNTARYGGCGGNNRAVYSAAYAPASSAQDIAAHEVAHSLAGLDDEYGGGGCGNNAGNRFNTSLDAADGEWPEWVAEIGAPREGARYYDQCVYRPMASCDMRSLTVPFCPVCNQRWALVFFGHLRTRPTAPLSGMTPPAGVITGIGIPVDFAVVTRLASGPAVTNGFTWRLQGPGFPTPTVVSTAGPAYSHSFAQAGTFTLTCEVVADTNFIKAPRNDGNVDTARWQVQVSGSCDPAPVFAGLREAVDLSACAATGVELRWEPAVFGPRGGSYEVWRDGTRVAGGIAASPHLDLPGDAATHDYRVQAISTDCNASDGGFVVRSAADGVGVAPTFAGLASATDLEACRQSGIELVWPAAVFGLAGGTYDVHRDGVRVATGVAGSPHVDRPGDGASHAYRVQAISNDCALGDGNAVDRSAADASSGPPQALGNVLLAVRVGPGLHLYWSDTPGADSYEAGRSESRDFAAPIVSLGSVASGAPPAGGIADTPPAPPSLHVYRVRQELCGQLSSY